MFLCLDWVFVILISFRWQIPKKEEALRIEIVETAEIRRRRKRELPLSHRLKKRTFLKLFLENQ